MVGELIDKIFHGKQGLCHTMALPFTLRRIREIQIFQTLNPLKETKILQDIITL
jgi:hypothetical protein